MVDQGNAHAHTGTGALGGKGTVERRTRQKPILIVFDKDTEAAYDSQGGQHITFTIPKGTQLSVPASLVYGV